MYLLIRVSHYITVGKLPQYISVKAQSMQGNHRLMDSIQPLRLISNLSPDLNEKGFEHPSAGDKIACS